MGSYWIRHRLLLTVVFCLVLSLILGLFFGFPYISQQSAAYSSQSIYKNSRIDFIAPEPSFEQVTELPGQHGIASVFPYFITDADVSINGKTSETTVLLSDQFQNLDITMYSQKRLIKKSETDFENPILVDWKFCDQTSADIGDTVSFYIGDDVQEFKVYAIYETNTAFDGALLAKINETQFNKIVEQSDSHGYSAMFVSASDYNTCKTFFTTDYRPLGRLRARSEFSSDESYQIHYDAIMSSDFANEVTDFRINEKSLESKGNTLLIWLGAILAVVALIAFNFIMAKRGQEGAYFTKHCIPRGQDVKPYYYISFCAESILSICFFLIVVAVRVKSSSEFISGTFGDGLIFIIPAAMLFAGVVNLYLNNSKVKAASSNRATVQLQPDPSIQSIKAESYTVPSAENVPKASIISEGSKEANDNSEPTVTSEESKETNESSELTTSSEVQKKE